MSDKIIKVIQEVHEQFKARGNWGHSGRPGKVGGSTPGGGLSGGGGGGSWPVDDRISNPPAGWQKYGDEAIRKMNAAGDKEVEIHDNINKGRSKRFEVGVSVKITNPTSGVSGWKSYGNMIKQADTFEDAMNIADTMFNTAY